MLGTMTHLNQFLLQGKAHDRRRKYTNPWPPRPQRARVLPNGQWSGHNTRRNTAQILVAIRAVSWAATMTNLHLLAGRLPRLQVNQARPVLLLVVRALLLVVRALLLVVRALLLVVRELLLVVRALVQVVQVGQSHERAQ
jgi:hypothetical protein